jgi:hypothetical protein
MVPKLTYTLSVYDGDVTDDVKKDFDNFFTPFVINNKNFYPCNISSLIDCGFCNEYCKAMSLDVYGFCDTEKAMLKYLKNFLDNNEPYLIEVGITSIDYENYHKQGPFINDYGKPVYEDYWDYVEDVDVNRDIEDCWITFRVYRLIEN